MPKIISNNECSIDHDRIDKNALYIIEKLSSAGYTAYLVGGSVRDLLLDLKPKDFDISTSAKPHEIKKLFKNCLLIGRRFRLAHIRFGSQIFEVSTFRSGDNLSEGELIVRDNEWGSPEEDVLRRDFTINGLFYDPIERELIDYVDGCEDVKRRVLRTVGDPVLRFKQDPVRMLRLLKFHARLGLTMDAEALEALKECQEEIHKSAPARILEEMLRMLESGSAEPFIRVMVEQGMMEHVFPWLWHFLQGEHREDVYTLLRAADKDVLSSREHGHEGPTRAVLAAALLFPILKQELHRKFLSKDHNPHLGEVNQLITHLLKGISHSSFSQFPKRIRAAMHYVLHTQMRLTPLADRSYRPQKMVHHKEFHDALAFLKVRALADPDLDPVYQHWYSLTPQKKSRPVKRNRRPRRHDKQST